VLRGIFGAENEEGVKLNNVTSLFVFIMKYSVEEITEDETRDTCST
jgi:hypothetical protein